MGPTPSNPASPVREDKTGEEICWQTEGMNRVDRAISNMQERNRCNIFLMLSSPKRVTGGGEERTIKRTRDARKVAPEGGKVLPGETMS